MRVRKKDRRRDLADWSQVLFALKMLPFEFTPVGFAVFWINVLARKDLHLESFVAAGEGADELD